MNKSLLRTFSVLLAAGLFVGCADGEPEPAFTPRSPKPAPTEVAESPDPDVAIDQSDDIDPPALPEFSDDPVEAAEQMLEYFIAAYDYGYIASDPDPLLKISHPKCGTCAIYTDRMLEQIETGEFTEGGTLALLALDAFPVNDDEIFVEVVIQQAARSDYTGEGTLIEKADAKLADMKFVLRLVDAKWTIRAIRTDVRK